MTGTPRQGHAADPGGRRVALTQQTKERQASDFDLHQVLDLHQTSALRWTNGLFGSISRPSGSWSEQQQVCLAAGSPGFTSASSWRMHLSPHL